jgi:hypothetical protein
MLYDLVKEKTKDEAGRLNDPTDYDNAMIEALKRYSKHRPRLVCEDIPGEDGPDIPLPADWTEAFSDIQGIEYPIGRVPEELLDRSDWRFYRTPTDTYIRFLTARPGSDESVRLLYTVLHVEATLPVGDTEAVANLAASLCCRQLAAIYGNTSDPTIQADVVNYRSKCDEYRRLADSLEKLYKEHLGIKDSDTTPAAMATAPPPVSSRNRLTHGRG